MTLVSCTCWGYLSLLGTLFRACNPLYSVTLLLWAWGALQYFDTTRGTIPLAWVQLLPCHSCAVYGFARWRFWYWFLFARHGVRLTCFLLPTPEPFLLLLTRLPARLFSRKFRDSDPLPVLVVPPFTHGHRVFDPQPGYRIKGFWLSVNGRGTCLRGSITQPQQFCLQGRTLLHIHNNLPASTYCVYIGN